MEGEHVRVDCNNVQGRMTVLRAPTLVGGLLLLLTTGCAFLQPQSQVQTPAPTTATTSAGGHPAIVVGTVSGAPGQDVLLTVTLQAAGAKVAGTENDLNFDAANVSLGTGGKPSCRVNPAIEKGGTAFAFRPTGCKGTACATARALVLAMDNTDPIADGAALYTCTVHISPSAPPGQYRIRVSGVVLSTPAGQVVPNAAGSDGMVSVSAAKK